MNFFSVYQGSFLGVKCCCMKLTTQLHLMPRSRMCRAIPQIPLYAFTAETGTCLPSPSTINLTHNLYIFYTHHCTEQKLSILLESERISFNSLQTDNIGTDLHVTQHNGMFQLNTALLNRFTDTGFL
jgi:hypothetical protein